MILVIGLGNPGKKYKNTRHNIGFMVLDSFLKKATSVRDSTWEVNSKFNCWTARVNEELMLVKPLSFMNASGEIVAQLTSFYKVSPFGLFVVHDDVDLPLGKIKISVGHGSAGHKGIGSIIQKLQSKDFVRIRVGVGTDRRMATEDFVLLPFERGERGKLSLSQLIKKTVEAMEFILKEGAEKAANKYNQ